MKKHTTSTAIPTYALKAEALRRLGAEVMQGDLTDLTSMHEDVPENVENGGAALLALSL